jgi:hypothetical protein
MHGLLPPIHASGPQAGSSGLTVPGQMSGSMPFMQGVPLHMMQLSSVTPMLVHWSAGFMKAFETPKKSDRMIMPKIGYLILMFHCVGVAI